MCPHSIPVFLGNAGIGLPHGFLPPQIRGFDVYYKLPIVVGFHVVGSKEIIGPEISVTVQDITDNSPKVVGFYAFGIAGESCCTDPQFLVEVAQVDDSPKVLGFYAVAVQENTTIESGFLAQLKEGDDNPQILGFYAIGVT